MKINLVFFIAIAITLSTVSSAHASTSGSAPFQLRWPVEFSAPWTKINSTFGPRLHAADNYAYEFHKGLDIVGTTSDQVVAAAAGEVFSFYHEGEADSPYPTSGNVVVLKHTVSTPFQFHHQLLSTYYTVHLHLSSINPDLVVGQSIQAGDPLGYIGQSGITEFTHLHFEVRLGSPCSLAASCNHVGFDPQVNPLRYLAYPQTNQVTISRHSNQDQLRVNVQTNQAEPDLNRIIVTTFDSNQQRLKRRVVDFSKRTHTDQTTVVLAPKRYSVRNQYYRLSVYFSDLIDGATASTKIKVCDVHGNCIKK